MLISYYEVLMSLDFKFVYDEQLFGFISQLSSKSCRHQSSCSDEPWEVITQSHKSLHLQYLPISDIKPPISKMDVLILG